jgi:hypothetical protein
MTIIFILEDKSRTAIKIRRNIMGSLDGLTESEIESLWVEEAERRLDELNRGVVHTIPSEEVLHRARNILS